MGIRLGEILPTGTNFFLLAAPGSGYPRGRYDSRGLPARIAGTWLEAVVTGSWIFGRKRSVVAMAAPQERPGESSSEGQGSIPETSTRRLRELSQLDFELEFVGRILERDPFFTDGLRVHGNNLSAKGLYTRALQVDRRLVRLLPERAIPWYNLACSYAVLGMVDPAFSALQRALELGYRHIGHVRRDPDLKSLRHDPRFARLLKRL
jgi:hypothetical protein